MWVETGIVACEEEQNANGHRNNTTIRNEANIRVSENVDA